MVVRKEKNMVANYYVICALFQKENNKLILVAYLKAREEMIKLISRKIPGQLGQQIMNILDNCIMLSSLQVKMHTNS